MQVLTQVLGPENRMLVGVGRAWSLGLWSLPVSPPPPKLPFSHVHVLHTWTVLETSRLEVLAHKGLFSFIPRGWHCVCLCWVLSKWVPLGDVCTLPGGTPAPSFLGESFVPEKKCTL